MRRLIHILKIGLFALIALIAAMAMACGDDDNSSKTPTTQAGSTSQAGATAATTPVSGDITVFAAASLTDSFKQIGADFHTDNPSANVTFQFGGSPALVTQLGQGAPADSLAMADQKNMQNALDQSVVKDAGAPFAKNRLVIIFPRGNPANITAAKDMANAGVKVVLAQEDVPVGNYARQSLDKYSADPAYGADFKTKVLANLVSEEPNVKAVVTKIQLGEADAGIVYVTDVTKDVQGDIATIPIEDQYNIIATYPIAITSDAEEADVAQAFINYVLSEKGQATLKEYGFIPVN